MCDQVNGHDVTAATRDEAVQAIRSASEPIVVEVLRHRTDVCTMDDDDGSPVTMMTTATQTDECNLDDDDDDVQFVDYCRLSAPQQYAFYDHL